VGARHILQQEWPSFLDRLDDDPARAAEEFYGFARTLLSVAPPRNLWEVPEDLREDVTHDLVLDCCRDGFALLRRYRDRGRPFAAWFALVARNRISDRMRRERRQVEWDVQEDDRRERPAVSPARRALDRVALEKVVSEVRALGDVCRVLLLGAAEGRSPRELVHLLGWPEDWNKKASDDLRACRKRLRRRLEAVGVDPEEILAG
jgi:DNA-directed RNA polymerase specialized sigma24 family protein